jgi:hypothetical protein
MFPTPVRFRPQFGYSVAEFLIMFAVLATLLAGAVALKQYYAPGPVFVHPGTAQSAQLLVRNSLSGVDQVGEPTITGDREVTLPATIAKKDCKVQLHAPKELENDYGWKIKQVDCAGPPLA